MKIVLLVLVTLVVFLLMTPAAGEVKSSEVIDVARYAPGFYKVIDKELFLKTEYCAYISGKVRIEWEFPGSRNNQIVWLKTENDKVDYRPYCRIEMVFAPVNTPQF